MKIISLFLNSPEYRKVNSEELDKQSHSYFPLYDPVGWRFTKRAILIDPDIPKDNFDPKYFLDEEKYIFLTVLFYKDAYLYHGPLVFLSIC